MTHAAGAAAIQPSSTPSGGTTAPTIAAPAAVTMSGAITGTASKETGTPRSAT